MITQPKLTDIRYWVFDMDGTLTQPVHDFPSIKRALEIPQEADILAHLAALPKEEATAKHAWLIDHERVLAENAKPALGAVELVNKLKQQNYRLAILTRNDRELAHITLKAIGLDDCFESDYILGRDEAPPKPSPEGLLKIAEKWQVKPQQTLIIGDYLHDVACGKNANTHTLLVNQTDNLWPELVDWYYPNCQLLLTDL